LNQKEAVYNYCYINYYRRELSNFDEQDLIRFRKDYEYFLPANLSKKELLFEFNCFHLHKWIKRLGMKFTVEDTREFMKVKMEEFLMP